MASVDLGPLAALYLEDETAWLDSMADLVRARDLDGLDLDNLAEYLTDMASRDRDEVESRLCVLLMHILKWEHQPKKRTRSWRTTLIHQQLKLARRIRKGVLRPCAVAVLSEAYADAIKLATSETGLPAATFPEACPYTVDQLLSMNLADGEIV